MAFDFPASPAVDDTYTMYGVTYTWNGYAWTRTTDSAAGGAGDYVLKTGDIMSGHLLLNADPVQPLHAATKQYVDSLALPLGGVAGQALVKNPTDVPTWGAPIQGGNF